MELSNKITHENVVFKNAASFLPKHKLDIVAQFADSLNVYVIHYYPLQDLFQFSNGEIIHTATIIFYMRGKRL